MASLSRGTLAPMPSAANTEALRLSETVSLAVDESDAVVFDSDKTVPLHIIRPGVGKGRGRHLYEAQMLQRNAHKFAGWRMYVDHRSPEARRAAGGLPRSVRDLGGRIVESKWDPSVPADPQRGYGPGAVVGRCRPVKWMRELIEDDPALVEASISAQATAVKPLNHQGQRVWAVEGIEDRGSVDWVTEGGAGGRVAPLIESSYASDEEVEMALLESMSDDEFVEYMQEARPQIQLAEAPEPDEPDEPDAPDAEDEPDAATKKFMKKGMSRADAEKFAKHIKESEEDDMTITPEALQEALSSSPDLLAEAIQQSEVLQQAVATQVAQALSEERVVADAERDAVIDRQWELRDLRDRAHEIIAESRLPETWQEGLRDRFTLREDRAPTPELDVVDELDSDGNVTKPAQEKLTEAVELVIKQERRRLAEVAPTRVRGQGPAELKEGEEADEAPKGEPGFHTTLLQEAGIDPEKAYAGI